jgi:hypothetical protein
MLAAYAVHFLLECVAHVCKCPWHRVGIWLIGTLLTTIITVHLIG